jgi:hypothetical protein
METKENEVETLDKLAMSITGGLEKSEDLLNDLQDIRRDYLSSWLTVDDENYPCISKETIRLQMVTLDRMIQTLSR